MPNEHTTKEAGATIAGVAPQHWRVQLAEALNRSGKTATQVSSAADHAADYLQSVLDGRLPPSIRGLTALSEVLGIDAVPVVRSLLASGDSIWGPVPAVSKETPLPEVAADAEDVMGIAVDSVTVNSVAADIQGLYDQLTPPQKAWFLEQLRRGARGEPTFLDDPDQHGFEAWVRQPAPTSVETTAALRARDTLSLEDDLDDARRRLCAVEFFVQHACTDRDVGAGIGSVVGDVVDVLQDVSETLGDMRREGGAA